jgi:excisionase family DNA binding protein
MPAIGYNLRMAHVYSVEEAAKELGLEASHIRRLLRKGEIKGKRLGRDWAVLSLTYQRKRKPKTKRGESQNEK